MTAQKQWKDFHHNARMAVRCNRDPNTSLTINGRTVWLWRGPEFWYVPGQRAVLFHLNHAAAIRRALIHRADANNMSRAALIGQARLALTRAQLERKRQADRTY